ncbi:hypothetical protein CEXT_704231 [Caerostris extrusa]|uniref:Uncharacterized protein n=1 Tax=Caerostris extrusa TaxID=172846 RepID=A0AAV4XAT0_CAEEX|nr:hypothetical protein CEXT_704231 [Caerostris extrusa]
MTSVSVHSGRRDSLSGDVTGVHVMLFFRNQMGENSWHPTCGHSMSAGSHKGPERPLRGNGKKLFILADNTLQKRTVFFAGFFT